MDVPEYLYARLISAGMTKEGACAVLGNVQAESAFRTNNVEDRSGIPDEVYTQQLNSGSRNKQQFMYDTFGYGLAQWTYPPRKGWMWDWFKERATSFDDLIEQVNFLIWEMKTHYSGCWNLCTSSSNLYDCTKKLLWEWENPADKNGQLPVRYNYAMAWFAKLSGADISAIEEPAITVIDKPEVDDDGIRVEKTWPPRTIDKRCGEFKEVKLLETLLACHGYNVVVEGIFGEALDKKVRKYQTEHGLAADGVVGNATWKSLMKLPEKW